MQNWLTALARMTAPAMLVTVANAAGSVPRKPGAKMLVWAGGQADTIGGGHLELQACETARELLRAGSERSLQRIALGPSLGQCCGGVTHLVFERIEGDSEYAVALQRSAAEHADTWRLVSLDSGKALAIDDPASAPLEFDPSLACHLLERDGRQWMIDPCRAPRARLMLFGAGHVGSAIVRALADLPCQVTWVDARDDLFPENVAANVDVDATDTPEALIDAAPPGTSFLVMTHSHALDLQLSEKILRRSDGGWFGLIGSQTKRSQFERRLRERGIGFDRLAAMVCPIGIPGIAGKAPAVIAVAVVAQLLQVWELQHQYESN